MKAATFFIAMMLGLVGANAMAQKASTDAVSRDLASTSSVGAFEGRWQHCFGHQGSKICLGYDLLHRGNKVCGSWTGFATDVYEGKIKALASSEKHAEVTQICNDFGSYGQANCVSEAISWTIKPDTENPGSLYLCQERLYQGIDSCKNISVKKGMSKSRLMASQKNQLLSDPAMQACLLGK